MQATSVSASFRQGIRIVISGNGVRAVWSLRVTSASSTSIVAKLHRCGGTLLRFG